MIDFMGVASLLGLGKGPKMGLNSHFPANDAYLHKSEHRTNSYFKRQTKTKRFGKQCSPRSSSHDDIASSVRGL